MQFTIKNDSGENLLNLMRKINYHYIGGNPASASASAEASAGKEEKAEYNFIRPLGGGGGFPRFHIYLVIDKESKLIFNLHLDQKKPIYRGTTAHSGEYDGELVEKEVKRIKKVLNL